MNLFSPDQLMLALNQYLADWTEAGQKVTRFIAKDPWHPYELIAGGPNGLCVVLSWAGASPLGNEEAEGLTLATQKLDVFLSYNPGLSVAPDDALVKGTDTRPSLLKLVGLLSRRILSMKFSDESDVRPYFRWAGTSPVTAPDGTPLRAFRMQFELDTDVEEPQPQEI